MKTRKHAEENLLTNYKILETDRFFKKLEKFKNHLDDIREKLKEYVYPQLKDQPYFGNNIKKLKDYRPETWRYRIGDYRIFYQIDGKEKIVSIVSVETRQDAY